VPRDSSDSAPRPTLPQTFYCSDPPLPPSIPPLSRPSRLNPRDKCGTHPCQQPPRHCPAGVSGVSCVGGARVSQERGEPQAQQGVPGLARAGRPGCRMRGENGYEGAEGVGVDVRLRESAPARGVGVGRVRGHRGETLPDLGSGREGRESNAREHERCRSSGRQICNRTFTTQAKQLGPTSFQSSSRE
jgi:hypothetical protein